MIENPRIDLPIMAKGGSPTQCCGEGGECEAEVMVEKVLYQSFDGDEEGDDEEGALAYFCDEHSEAFDQYIQNLDDPDVIMSEVNPNKPSRSAKRVGDPMSVIPCLFCGHKHLTMSDRYSWGPTNRAGTKAMFKRGAYSDAPNVFPDAFGEWCITVIDLIKLRLEHDVEKHDADVEEMNPLQEIEYALKHLEDLEDYLIEHGTKKEQKNLGEDETAHPTRVCALCWDRAMNAANGKAVFKLFK